MSSYRMQEKNRLRFATHSQYIFLQPLPGLQIVGSSQKKNKQSENRKCAIWERPRAFFASRFTARMHVTIFESFLGLFFSIFNNTHVFCYRDHVV